MCVDTHAYIDEHVATAARVRLLADDPPDALAGECLRLSARDACYVGYRNAALWSPGTGIVDSHALMLALLGDAEAAGAVLAVQSPVTCGALEAEGMVIECDSYTLNARLVVNCAGLSAPRIAASISGMPHSAIPAQRLAKGSYFSLTGRAPFSSRRPNGTGGSCGGG